jgi:hypothetical protein
MLPLRGLGWACALVLLGAGASPSRAAWCNVFQTCGHCCDRPVVSGYASVQTTYYVQRCYYEPPHCCRCGPIKRLLGLCRCCRPCPPPPVAVVAPLPPPPCAVPVAPGVPYPVAPTAPPPLLAPAPAPVPGSNLAVPPAPGVPGSPSGAIRPRAPVSARPVTPPALPAPVRLDHFVSDRAPRTQTPALLVSEPRAKTP